MDESKHERVGWINVMAREKYSNRTVVDYIYIYTLSIVFWPISIWCVIFFVCFDRCRGRVAVYNMNLLTVFFIYMAVWSFT